MLAAEALLLLLLLLLLLVLLLLLLVEVEELLLGGPAVQVLLLRADQSLARDQVAAQLLLLLLAGAQQLRVLARIRVVRSGDVLLTRGALLVLVVVVVVVEVMLLLLLLEVLRVELVRLLARRLVELVVAELVVMEVEMVELAALRGRRNARVNHVLHRARRLGLLAAAHVAGVVAQLVLLKLLMLVVLLVMLLLLLLQLAKVPCARRRALESIGGGGDLVGSVRVAGGVVVVSVIVAALGAACVCLVCVGAVDLVRRVEGAGKVLGPAKLEQRVLLLARRLLQVLAGELEGVEGLLLLLLLVAVHYGVVQVLVPNLVLVDGQRWAHGVEELAVCGRELVVVSGLFARWGRLVAGQRGAVVCWRALLLLLALPLREC